MIRVRIDTTEYELSDVSEAWIVEQVNRRRHDGIPICIQVIIDKGEVNLMLATSGCGSGGGERQPNPKELSILDLWSDLGLNNDDFVPGKIIAFLKQLQSIC